MRGFTFIEIMMVVFLLLILFFIASPKMTMSLGQRTEARAAAMKLTEDIRYLRQRAITTGIPTALVIPNNNLSLGHTQVYNMMEGVKRNNNSVITTVNLKNLYRSVSLFIGYWDLDSKQLFDPTFGNSTSPARSYSNSQGYNIAAWGGGSKDYTFLFTPEGAVIANGNMPNFDNSYHIIIGRSYEYFEAPLPSGPKCADPGSLTTSFKIKSVSNPVYTVTITPVGEVSISPGVVGLPDTCYNTGVEIPGTGALPEKEKPDADELELSEVLLTPKINRLVYPENTGVDGVVPVDGHITISIKAKDTDGDPVQLVSESVGSDMNGSSEGSFLPSGPVNLKYNPVNNIYEGSLEWVPPANATISKQFTLKFTASDHAKKIESKKIVQISDNDKIVITQKSNVCYSEIYIMNGDGTNQKKLTSKCFDTQPNLSSNGKKVVFIRTDLSKHQDFICMVGTDGKGLKQLSSSGGSEPSWSPDCTKIAFTKDNAIWVMNADGSEHKKITSGNGEKPDYWPSWAPDGKKLLFTSQQTGKQEIHVINFNGSGSNQVSNVSEIVQEPSWSPNGKKILFRTGQEQGDINIINEDGTGHQKLTNEGKITNSTWSPDGKRILFYSVSGATINQDNGTYGEYDLCTIKSDGTDKKLILEDLGTTDRLSWRK